MRMGNGILYNQLDLRAGDFYSIFFQQKWNSSANQRKWWCHSEKNIGFSHTKNKAMMIYIMWSKSYDEKHRGLNQQPQGSSYATVGDLEWFMKSATIRVKWYHCDLNIYICFDISYVYICIMFACIIWIYIYIAYKHTHICMHIYICVCVRILKHFRRV